jgi:hypothetical protein
MNLLWLMECVCIGAVWMLNLETTILSPISSNSLHCGKTIIGVSQHSGDGCDCGWYGRCNGIANSNAAEGRR